MAGHHLLHFASVIILGEGQAVDIGVLVPEEDLSSLMFIVENHIESTILCKGMPSFSMIGE